MENPKQTSFTFEIDNFSEKEAVISSPKFLSGGCEWFVRVHPKGDIDIVDDHVSLYLFAANSESLRLGWKRRASYSFALLNESGKELLKTKELCELFCAQINGWGISKVVPLNKLQEKGFLEKNKLIIKVEVKVVEMVDEGDVTGKEMIEVRGFKVLYSQFNSVIRLFMKHPDIAANFRLKNESVKTTYINLLLGLIQTLEKPTHSISETELNSACSELTELTEAGFKLDWLKTKIDEVSLEKKKENARVQELEEQIDNLTLELNKEKRNTDSSAVKVVSLEQTVSNLQYELNKEKQKSAVKVLSLEQTVSELKGDVSDLKDEVSALEDELKKEKRISAAKVLSLEQTVLNLRDELKKEKAGACSWEVLDYADL